MALVCCNRPTCQSWVVGCVFLAKRPLDGICFVDWSTFCDLSDWLTRCTQAHLVLSCLWWGSSLASRVQTRIFYWIVVAWHCVDRLLDLRNLMQVRQYHRRDKVVLSALMSLVQTPRQVVVIVATLRRLVSLSTVYNLRNSRLARREACIISILWSILSVWTTLH